MEAKVGDRVSLDAKKVGQPTRNGVIQSVTKGLSGTRYQIRWDDGHESVISPGAGILTISGRGNGKRAAPAKPKRTAAKKAVAKKKKTSKR